MPQAFHLSPLAGRRFGCSGASFLNSLNSAVSHFSAKPVLGRDVESLIRAPTQWRFEPGRLQRMPVGVLVSLQVDFHIR